MSPALHEATNYHAWTHSWVDPYLRGGRVLDIGSGTGNHLRNVQADDLTSVDIDAAAVAELRARYATSKPGWRFETLDLTAPGAIDKLGRASFDVVFSSNVFEHIPDDVRMFQAAWDLLKPGGRIVLLLPAHQFLYGSMDRIVGHHRRYDRALIRERFQATGFIEDRIRFVNALGAIGWLVNRLANHKDIESRSIGLQVKLFDRLLVPVIRKLEGDRDLPFGQSVLAVGRKAPDPSPT